MNDEAMIDYAKYARIFKVMSCTADRKPLRDSFHDSEQNDFQYV